MRKILLGVLALFTLGFSGAPAATVDDQTSLLGVGNFRPGYTPPVLVNQYALAFGDSRTANAGGVIYATPSFSTSAGYSNGYAGWLFPLSANKIVPEAGWNYGVGAQSTAGIRGRLAQTGADCNNISASYTAPCFTGAHTTTSGTTANGATSIVVTSATGIAANDYVNVGSGTQLVFQAQVSASYVSGTTIPLTIATTGSISNNSAIAFSPVANSSSFASNLGASGAGATITDVDNNIGSTAVYSPETDPAQVVFLLGGTNDGNLTLSQTQPQSLVNIAAELDALGPSGANKIVILGDEVPRGLATGYSSAASNFNGSPEIETINGSNQITVVNSANYYDTEQVFYAPAGTGAAPFVAGTNDGAALTNCTTGTTAAPNGTASCTPASGQYSVVNGVYTFNAAQTGLKIGIYYRWLDNNQTSPNYLTTVHDWINDSTHCSNNFVDSASGLPYNISGAQCGRPWVHVAATWEAAADATIANNCHVASCPNTTTSAYPSAYASVDGLHPEPYGGALVANAMITAAQAAGAIQATAPIPLPTTNNIYFGGNTYNGSATETTTCAPNAAMTAASVTNATAGAADWYMNSLSPAASTLVYGAAGATSSGPKIWFSTTTSGIPGGTSVTCVDTTHNLLQMAAPATATSSSTTIQAQLDFTSFISDGVFSTLNSQMNTTAAITGCGTSNVNCATPSGATKGQPAGWTVSLDSGSQTAVGAGTLGFSYGMEHNPFSDGYDDFIIQFQGYWGTGTPNISMSENVIANQLSAIAAGDNHRAYCEVLVSAGPNGHLYGLGSFTLKFADTTSTAFKPPGPASTTGTTYTTWNGQFGSGSVEFSDQSVSTGAPGVNASNILVLDELSPPSQAGNPPTGATMSMSTGGIAGDPVSATVRFRRCWAGKASV